jgi:hypothetical protein
MMSSYSVAYAMMLRLCPIQTIGHEICADEQQQADEQRDSVTFLTMSVDHVVIPPHYAVSAQDRRRWGYTHAAED